jgi:hypothetical protein
MIRPHRVKRYMLAVALALALTGRLLSAQVPAAASAAVRSAPSLTAALPGARPSVAPMQPLVHLVTPVQARAGVGHRALLGAVTGMVVAVGATALWVGHCNRTDHHSEGPPCEIAYVYPGIPVIAGAGMVGAFIGSKW